MGRASLKHAECPDEEPPLGAACIAGVAATPLTRRCVAHASGRADPATDTERATLPGMHGTRIRAHGLIALSLAAASVTCGGRGRTLFTPRHVATDCPAPGTVIEKPYGTWSPGGSMNVPRTSFATVHLENDKVVVLGGVSLEDHPQTLTSSPCTHAVEVWDPNTATWSNASPMTHARCAHTATRLSDGRVLVVGGSDKLADFRGQIADAEIWDPHTDAWTPVGAMAVTRAGHTATALRDGRVLVVGGDAAGLGHPTTAEVWDGKSGWKTIAAPAAKFFQHRALRRNDGTVLVFGGPRINRAGELPVEATEAWDPRTEEWQPGPNLPITNATSVIPTVDGKLIMVEPGAEAGARVWNPENGTTEQVAWPDNVTHLAVQLDDKTFLIYGYFGASLFQPATGQVLGGGMARECCLVENLVALDNGSVLALFSTYSELWSPGNALLGGWRSAGGLLTTLRRRSALSVTGDGLFVAGGERSPEAQWFSLPSGQATALLPMSDPREDHATVALNDGTVLVFGGVDDTREVRISLDSSETWDVKAKRWRNAGDLVVSRAGATGTLLDDGRVLAVGGWSGRQSARGSDSSVTKTTELWDPVTRKWRRTGDLLEGRFEHTATVLLDGRVLIAGGSLSGDPPAPSAEVWDPGTQEWTRIADMTTPRRRHLATRLDDGRVLVVGGVRVGPNLTSSEIWDPVTGQWTEAPAAPAESLVGDLVALSGGRALFFGKVGEGCFVSIFDGESWSPRLSHARTNCVEYAHRVSDRDVVAVTQAGCVYNFDPDEAP